MYTLEVVGAAEMFGAEASTLTPLRLPVRVLPATSVACESSDWP